MYLACAISGSILGLIILYINPPYAIALIIGIIMSVLSIISLEFGLASIFILLTLFQRSQLFSVSIPFLVGGIKPTDVLLISILSGWVLRTCIGKKKLIFNNKFFIYIVILFIVWAIMSVFNGVSQGATLKYSLLELRPLLQYLLIIPIVTELEKKSIQRILWVLLIFSTIISLKAITLYIYGIGEEALYAEGSIRIMSIDFVYPLFAIIISFVYYIYEFRYKQYYLIVMILNLAALVITFQRSAWIGLFVSMAFILYSLKNNILRYNYFKIIIYVCLIGSIIYTSFIVSNSKSVNPVLALEKRLSSIFKYKEDVSAQHRINELDASLNIIKEHPFIGNGLGTRVLFYSPMYSEEGGKMGGISDDIYIHNSYLWITVKMGFVGLVLFVLIIYLNIKTGVKNIRIIKYNDQPTMLIGVVSCFLGLLISSFFGPMLTIDSVTPFVAFFSGAIYKLSN
jgi:O-antigen ligase